MSFFVTNEYLNSKFPLASCARGSMDYRTEEDWYLRDLSSRLLSAFHINDQETMRQLRARIEIHQACRRAHGVKR